MMKMYACVDVGGSAIKVAVANKEGELFEKQSFKLPPDFDGLVTVITDWVAELQQRHEIVGLAFSLPGAVHKSGVIGGSTAVDYIHGPNIIEIFKEKTNLNISIENDANCAALAEVFSGSGKDYQDLMVIVCGTGIGGAIIKDSKIHYGTHLYGGEFGYMLFNTVDGNYISLSDCGATGSLVKKVQAHYQELDITGEKIFELAANGDEFCVKAIDEFYLYLAQGVFNLQHIYDPEIILFGGAISMREDFITSLEANLEKIRQSLGIPTLKPKLDRCKYKKDANLVGALACFLQEN